MVSLYFDYVCFSCPNPSEKGNATCGRASLKA